MLNFSRGYTLVELMITVTLVGVLVMIGVPALTHTIDDQRIGSTSRNLSASLALARHAAISQRYPVLVESLEGNWEAGWSVYIDANSNGDFDPGEQELLRQATVPSGVQITPNHPVQSYVRYVVTGQAQLMSGAFQAGTFSICHENGQHDVRRLVLSSSGRVRSAKDDLDAC